MSSKRLNQNAEIWLRTARLCGIGSGRTTSKADSRSVTTNKSVSPRSKTSRTLPLRSFLSPGISIIDCGAVCIFKRKRSNVCRQASSKNRNGPASQAGLSTSTPRVEATLHVINSVAIRLEYRVIAEFGRPDIGIVRMNDIPANASFAHTALQVRNVCRLPQTLQLMQLRLVGRLSESLACAPPHLKPGSKRRPLAQSTQDKKLVLMRILRDCVRRKLAPDVMRTLN